MKKTAILLLMAMLLSLFAFASCGGTKYETVMEYKGIKLTENMYNYWVATFKRNILSSLSDARDTEAFWGQKLSEIADIGELNSAGGNYTEETTVEDYFTEIINRRIRNYLIAQSLFKENRLKLDSEVKKAIDADIKEKIDFYGSRSALNSELSVLMLNVKSLETVYTWEEKHTAVYDYYFGQNGTEPISNERLTEYYEKNYSRIKYIVFYLEKLKTDEEGNYVYDSAGQVVTEEMTAQELEEKKAKIAECYEKLENGESFDEMRKKYSEYDTSGYPNGFFVSANEVNVWGSGIVKGAAEAESGEIFRVDEEEAVYLVLKCDLPKIGELNEDDVNQLSSLSVYATQELYEEKFDSLATEVTVNAEVMAKYRLSKVPVNPFYAM